MKSPKRIATLLLAGFFAFAPPGTLIFMFALLVGLVGRRWAGALAALCLCTGVGFLLLRRRRRRRARPGADDSVNLEEH
jgi:membrane protein implicated in regulation of membrane protease activity